MTPSQLHIETPGIVNGGNVTFFKFHKKYNFYASQVTPWSGMHILLIFLLLHIFIYLLNSFRKQFLREKKISHKLSQFEV